MSVDAACTLALVKQVKQVIFFLTSAQLQDDTERAAYLWTPPAQLNESVLLNDSEVHTELTWFTSTKVLALLLCFTKRRRRSSASL